MASYESSRATGEEEQEACHATNRQLFKNPFLFNYLYVEQGTLYPL